MKTASELTPAAQRVVDAAQELIQSRGYNGFSYDDISHRLGLRKASIHHHFRTKADLGATVVRRYTEDFRGKLAHIDASCSSPEARLRAYVELFTQTYARDRHLCPGGMLSTETESLPPEVVAEVVTFFEVSLTWLAQLFKQARPHGQPATDTSPERLALCLLSCLQGSMVVGRAIADPRASAAAVGDVGRTAVELFLSLSAASRPAQRRSGPKLAA
ncbi:TetR/AcrR family transcriptional regulator [Ramlibacter tataouinensis]|uniref:TetR/AcrR family transcriptional regulator n=1 Tax=Ramlibacter tataouinensis TaxID=94132 RepID=UPI0022F3F52D|nr:TetR/AcrR family transcriptional regulator [Ramlibacter tataouinensis]WBY02774.1 TetR/AcrR family transcriptional regulator [Ramlibacter tataouinensis]